MLFGSATQFLDAGGYSLSVHQLAAIAKAVSQRNQFVPSLKAKMGLPALPFEK
jgi:hypothetical protein